MTDTNKRADPEDTTAPIEDDFSLPRYKCHKEVAALKIRDLTVRREKRANDDGSFFAYRAASLVCVGPDGKDWPVEVITGPGWLESRFQELEDGDMGYYVRYVDGYESWSPSEAFEAGYSLIR